MVALAGYGLGMEEWTFFEKLPLYIELIILGAIVFGCLFAALKK